MEKFLIALDQGTTSCRSVLFGADLEKIDQEQKEFTQYFPKPGWVEHDAEEIWACQSATLSALLARNHLKPEQVAAIGITNQRETVVAWDKQTGKPLARAIVWQDRRTAEYCRDLRKRGREAMVRRKTGLVLDPYFSATKMRWLLKHDPAVKSAARSGRLAFGTIDSWLIYKMTEGNRHVTEVSNAARTMLMGVRACAWDPALVKMFGVPRAALPEILASDSLFGTADFPGLQGVAIHGVAGDQQASLFGHRCFRPGSQKNTYGTGCFMLRNIGGKYIAPPKGLLGTVAWTIRGRTEYAHEGAVLVGGAAIQFLRDGLKLIDSAPESEALAESLDGNDGVYFVPAFAGLGTPHWDAEARGLLIGLTRGTTRAHVVRAALESIAYQSQDLCLAFDGGSASRRTRNARPAKRSISIKTLSVDGGASRNSFLMQFQADILGAEVRVNESTEITALGVAMIAALGCGLIKEKKDLLRLKIPLRVFKPKMAAARRRELIRRWNRAVERAKGWNA